MAVAATDPFERLYRRYARDVYRFALSVVRNPIEAEDVTQTAFLNAFRAYACGERPERPHSWLIAIAHNTIRSRYRRRLRRPAEVSLDAAAELASPPAERSDAVDVLRALGELPAGQRDALTMRELEGRSYVEIASALGVSVSAVESLVARARRTLRRHREVLRGLLLLPLRHGNEAGAGFAAKTAVVVAAAGLAAGGMGAASKVAGQQHAAVSQTPTPAPAAAAAMPAPRTHAAKRSPASPSAAQAPALASRRPVEPPAAPPPVAPPPAPAAPSVPAPAPPPVRTAAPAPAPDDPVSTTTSSSTTTAAVIVAVTSTAGTALSAPATVATPTATVETPVATVTVPAVTVTVPLPSVPQVSGLLGVN